jgi:hypothetical protein
MLRRSTIGLYAEDIIALRHEAVKLADAQPLLQRVMRAGQPVELRPTLVAARARHATEMAHLPVPYRRVQGGEGYPVQLSAGLAARQHQVETALRQGHAWPCRGLGLSVSMRRVAWASAGCAWWRSLIAMVRSITKVVLMWTHS